MNRTVRYSVLLLIVPILVGGCFRARQLESLCQDLAWQFPEAEFDRDISLSLGSIPLGAAKLAAGFVDDARDAREILSGIRRVDVAVYKIRNLDDPQRAVMPERLEELLDDDWQIVVRTRENDERTWILYREDDDVVRDIHITVLDPKELVMVQISGDLTDVFERVLEDHHILTDAIEH